MKLIGKAPRPEGIPEEADVFEMGSVTIYAWSGGHVAVRHDVVQGEVVTPELKEKDA
jgi:hypothetical protein